MSGFEPFDNYRDDSLPVFNINSASFVPCRGHYKGEKEKRDDIEFSREESILLHQLLNVSPNELNSIKSSGNSRYGFIKQMLLYFSTHLGYPVELKSLEVLHELF